VSRYTIRGSEELDTRIDIHLDHIVQTAAPVCDAVILLGGYGRGEGTPLIRPNGIQAPFNDYDLVAVVNTVNPVIRLHFDSLSRQLSEDLDFPVDLTPYQRSRLSVCEFSLLNYEMKYGHMVLRGPEDILDAMPDYPHDAIPLHEGARLLLNRGKLLLDIHRRLAEPAPLSEEERLRFVKFLFKVWLAFGDAALLAAGQYNIAYSVKKTRIQNIGSCPDRALVIDRYLQAVELKEWGDFHALEPFDLPEELDRIRGVFLQFLPWYRQQYTTRECSIPKAFALNLRWTGTFCTRHPRERLYDTLIELLQDGTPLAVERFLELRRRFS
jgi:hypothetical protein